MAFHPYHAVLLHTVHFRTPFFLPFLVIWPVVPFHPSLRLFSLFVSFCFHLTLLVTIFFLRFVLEFSLSSSLLEYPEDISLSRSFIFSPFCGKGVPSSMNLKQHNTRESNLHEQGTTNTEIHYFPLNSRFPFHFRIKRFFRGCLCYFLLYIVGTKIIIMAAGIAQSV